MKVTPKMVWAVRGALMGRRKGLEKRRWLEVKVSHRTKVLMDQRAPLDGTLGQVLHKTVSEIETHVQQDWSEGEVEQQCSGRRGTSQTRRVLCS